MEEFDLETAYGLVKPEQNMITNKYENNFTQCQEYIKKYFFPIDDGEHYMRKGNEFICYDDVAVKKIYFNKLHKEISEWYFKHYRALFKLTCNPLKPKIEGKFINTFGGFLHQVKPYESYSTEIKAKVKMMNDFVFEVLCSSNEKVFNYTMKWYSNMCKGNKNDTVLYNRGGQGLGKSTFTDFMRYHVLGQAISMVSDSQPLRSNFNKVLMGMLFVVFEELPTFSKNEWAGVSQNILNMVTNKTANYTDKFEKTKKNIPNLNNYVINTNVEAIQHSDGRRFMIYDISTKRQQDHVFFGNLKNQCFNDEVGEAYFNYLLSINTDGFYSQNDMPETENKKIAKVELLCNEFKFIKDEYILGNSKIEKASVTEVYNKYTEYCVDKRMQALTKIKFNAKLKELGIEYYKSNDKNIYKITKDQLKQKFEKSGWIHELDEVEVEVKETREENPLDNMIDKDSIIKSLQTEIEELKKKLQSFEKPVDVKEVIPEVKKIIPEVKEENVVKNDAEFVEVDNDDDMLAEINKLNGFDFME